VSTSCTRASAPERQPATTARQSGGSDRARAKGRRPPRSPRCAVAATAHITGLWMISDLRGSKSRWHHAGAVPPPSFSFVQGVRGGRPWIWPRIATGRRATGCVQSLDGHRRAGWSSRGLTRIRGMPTGDGWSHPLFPTLRSRSSLHASLRMDPPGHGLTDPWFQFNVTKHAVWRRMVSIGFSPWCWRSSTEKHQSSV